MEKLPQPFEIWGMSQGAEKVSAPPRPSWLWDYFTDCDCPSCRRVAEAKTYIEHLEARCKALAEELESTFGYDTERFLEQLAEQAELQREARD